MANKQKISLRRSKKQPMPKYDEINFNPPAPVASVKLENLETGEIVTEVSMLVDTGADITLLPKSIVEGLAIRFGEADYELEGFDGSRSKARAAELRLIFLDKKFTGQFLVSENEDGILGRDILNHLKLLFDGKNLEWSESESK